MAGSKARARRACATLPAKPFDVCGQHQLRYISIQVTNASASSDVYFAPLKLRPFFEIARESGVDVDAILTAHGTTDAEISHPETRLPRLRCVAIIQALLAPLADPLVGLRAAERSVLKDIDVLGYLAQHCATALAALQATVGYARLVGDASRVSVTHEGREVVVTVGLSGGRSSLPELADFAVASGHIGLCLLTRGAAMALRVELARPRPRDPAAYRKFFGAPVRFGCPNGRVVYADAALLAPLEQSDARLAAILRQQADARLQRLPSGSSLTEQLRSRLSQHTDPGAPTPARMAAQLGMSERSLRRHLERAGHTFRALSDEVRRDRALQLLRAGELNLSEIAQQLGFSDGTTFGRAFRRWTGSNPSHHRNDFTGARAGARSTDENSFTDTPRGRQRQG